MAQVRELLLLLTLLICTSRSQLTRNCPQAFPGRDGRDGVAGRDGRPGDKGDRGDDGYRGEEGDKGLPGPPGVAGLTGLPGLRGERGFPGNAGPQGPAGVPGERGRPGQTGIPGPKGQTGDFGLKGAKGDGGGRKIRNIRQFTWSQSQSTDYGALKTVSFVKRESGTRLKVSFSANARMNSRNRCSRWYFTFNSSECSNPAKIDAVIAQSSSDNTLRHFYFDGICEGLASGTVAIAVNLGTCPGKSRGDAHTGWNSVSRIIVEELPA